MVKACRIKILARREISGKEPDIPNLFFPHGICIYQAVAEALKTTEAESNIYMIKGTERQKLIVEDLSRWKGMSKYPRLPVLTLKSYTLEKGWTIERTILKLSFKLTKSETDYGDLPLHQTPNKAKVNFL